MTLRQKPDARRIARFLSSLKKADWLGTARRWWPDYVFHYTDIQNAVSILKTGALLSRNVANSAGLMVTDNASQDIISSTDEELKDYVRLYFRPRTPTQYNNEGFRPVGRRSLQSHCPVPIYFLFDSRIVLSRADSRFTHGNLKSARESFSSASDFEKIPFESVYHSGPFEPHQRDTIVFHRHAEVIVPTQMDIGALRYIVCRSQAEYETLLHLLPPPTHNRWRKRIGIFPGLYLFEKKWTFVERVAKDFSSIVFYFNRDSQALGPFRVQHEIIDAQTFRSLDSANLPNYFTNQPLRLDLQTIGFPSDYFVRLWIDGQLAYVDRYVDDLTW